MLFMRIFYQIIICLLFYVNGFSQAQTVEFRNPGSYQWMVPCGVTSITVEAWGAGASGVRGTGGGGGGAYARKVISVSPGATYSLYVGRGGGTYGGSWLSNPNYEGENSVFGSNLVKAEGGGQSGSIVRGGRASSSIGDATFSGGNGGLVANGNGGSGGGGSAGTANDGFGGSSNSNSNGGMGGAGGVEGGGSGGRGGNNNSSGANGNAPGGGGGERGNTGLFSSAASGDGGKGRIMITYTGIPDYCTPSFSNVEPITNVTFAGINNTTTNSTRNVSDNEAFCLTANVLQGESSLIFLQGNTNGNYTNYFTVFIDWNQNGNFENNERYEIGSIRNSNGNNNQVLDGEITVPLSAKLGLTKMRVIKNYNTSPTNACGNYSYGQAEDYLVNVSSPCTNSVIPQSARANGQTSLTICEDTEVTLTQSGGTLGLNAQWVWRIGSASGPVIGTSLAANAEIKITPNATSTYFVNAEGGCSANTLSRNVTVTVNIKPIISLFSGNDNQTVCMNSPITNIVYTGTNITGANVTGLPPGVNGSLEDGRFVIKGQPANFGSFDYTVTTTGALVPCSNVSITGTITVSPAPINLNYTTVNGNYCTGNPIQLNNPSYSGGAPINYSVTPALPSGLSLDPATGIISGTPVFASPVQNYSITASNNCGSSVKIISIGVSAGASVFNVTPNGEFSFCSIESGINIGLSGSETGINYRLYKNGNPVSTVLEGTGTSLNFGLQTEGNYTIKATNGSCVVNMNGEAIIKMVPNPTTSFSYSSNTFCANGYSSIPIMAGTPRTGIFSSASGLVIDPETGIIDLTASNPGNYRVRYTIPAGGGCADYFYTQDITINAAPLVFDVFGGGSYCSGTTGVDIGLENSQVGVNYQLYRGATAIGSSVSGNGGEIIFENQTIAGKYSIRARKADQMGCEIMMNGNAVVSIESVPDPFVIIPSATTVCMNNVISLSATSNSNTTSSNVSVASGNLSFSIPNNNTGGTFSLLRVTGIPEGANITNITVKLNVSHPRVQDLIVNLKGPNGNVLNLFNNLAPSGLRPNRSNFTNTTFASAATNSIVNANPPYNGSYLPQTAMAVAGADVLSNNRSNVNSFQGLYGQTGISANGDWILSIRDNVSLNSGTFSNWDIKIEYSLPSNPLEVRWTPATNLYLDAAATIPYQTYIPAATVYSKPAASGSFTYTATASNSAGCTISKNQTIQITAAPTLTVAANYCDYPGKIRITANSDMNISNWLWTGDVTASPHQNRSSYVEPISAGVFNVSATASNGCQVTGAMSVAQELVFNGDFSQGNVGFTSGYTYVGTPYNGNPNSGLYPEKTYNVHHDGQYSHSNFWGKDHTVGSGLEPDNFMIVNGHANTVVWEQTVTVLPNTDYYFSAYAMNLNNVGNYARLRFEINGKQVGSTADLGASNVPKPTNSSEISPKNWVRFYSEPYWNSGNNTTATIRIVNLQTDAGGNDFGLDDISFGTLSNFLNLTSAPNTNNQVGICGDTDILDISYEIGGDGNHPTLSNLPQGLSTTWNGRDLRISGAATSFGEFNYQITSTGCNPKTALGKIYVDEPTKAGNFVAPIISTCYNYSVQIDLSNNVGNVTGWARSTNNGSTWTNIIGNGTSLNLNNVTSASLLKATVKNKNCAAVETPIVKVGVRNLWTGEQSTDWMAKKNWSDESLPTTTPCDNVIIPVVASGKYPVLNTGVTSVKNLQINPNARVTLLDGILQVAGTITNNGTLDATKGTIEFNGATIQNLSGSILKDKTIQNLTVSNSIGLNISAVTGDTLNITGTLAFGKPNAKLNTGDNITLKSTAEGTASVGIVETGNIIMGKFIVERHINLGTDQSKGQHGKSWQLLATPAMGTSIKDAWQEGAVSTGKTPLHNRQNGYGTLFTTGYNNVPANGFDLYTSPGPSIKTFDSETGNYDKGPINTSVDLYNPKGYMILVRGDRTVFTSIASANPTVLRSKGNILTGPTTAITVKKNTWESIGNPYPSQIDIRKLTLTGGVDKTIFVWDPKLGGSYGLGAFQTLTFDGTNYSATPGGGSYGSGANNYIQSGQAFMVQATGSDGTVRFTEGMKASGSQSVLRGGAGEKTKVGYLRTSLNGVANGVPFLTDGNLVQFSKEFSNDIDGMDARKMQNTSENLAILSSGKSLSVERRKNIIQVDTIFFHLSGVRVQQYQFEIEAGGLNSEGLHAWLEDQYLQTQTPLNLDGRTIIDFSIANIAASYASDRFRIIFKPAAPAAPLPVTFVSIKASQVNKDILVQWNVELEINLKHYEIEKSLDGITFEKISILLISNSHNGKYQWLDQNPSDGYNYYRIKSVDLDGKTTMSAIAKVLVDKGIGTISVYPNPITNGVVNLQMGNQPEGVYGIRLLNPVGQVLFAKRIKHEGGNYTEKINWDYKMARGMYQLEVTKPGGEVHLIKLVY
jgi:subtilisin-like proprotein convertase family protein